MTFICMALNAVFYMQKDYIINVENVWMRINIWILQLSGILQGKNKMINELYNL